VPLDPQRAIALAVQRRRAGVRLDPPALAADLGVSRATLHRRAGNRDALLGEALWAMTSYALEHHIARYDRERPDAVRASWVLARFRHGIATDPALRRLLDEEPRIAIRVLTDPRGRVQPRVVDAIAELLRVDVERGDIIPVLDVTDLAYAIVRIGESFLYADVLVGRPSDVDAATRLTEVLLFGRASS
jgi:AcrR family transcriptional regulator